MKFSNYFSKKGSYDVDVFTISRSPPYENNPPVINIGTGQSRFQQRYLVALIGFLVNAFLNVHRMNMSVSIVAMVNSTAVYRPAYNMSVSDACPLPNRTWDATADDRQADGEFVWSPATQGYVQSSSFFGYLLSLLVCGKLAERFGCKWVAFWGVFLSSLATFLTPFAAWWNVGSLLVAQAVRGMAQGTFTPAVFVMTANWFPKSERGPLSTFMLAGQCIGTVAGGLGSGLLCDSSLFGGWPAVFYIFGGAGLALSGLIALLLHENPSVNPRISQAELKYILSNQENALPQRRPDIPWRGILTSGPFYANCVASFGMCWYATHFLVVHPTFLGAVLHFPIDQNGMLSSVPCLLQMVCGLLGGWISSFLNRRNLVGVDKVRKMWNSVTCLGYAAGLLGIYWAGCDRALNVAFVTFSIGVEGFAFPGSLIVPADMSPTFAGTLVGLVSATGSLASILLPLVVGWLTDTDQSLEQWNKVLFVSMAVVVASGVVFALFGSAEVQPWNFVEESGRQSARKDEKTQDSKDPTC